MKIDFEVLDKLRARGVRRARFDGEGLAEVEFFDGAAPAPMDEEGAARSAETDEDTRPYVLALQQIRTRRFVKKESS